MRIRVCLGILVLFIAACVPLPQRVGVPVEQRPSANFDERRANFVILHYTSSADAERALRTLTDPLARVSAKQRNSQNFSLLAGNFRRSRVRT